MRTLILLGLLAGAMIACGGGESTGGGSDTTDGGDASSAASEQASKPLPEIRYYVLSEQ